MGFVKTRDRECACGVSRGHSVFAALAALAVLATTPHYGFEFLRASRTERESRSRLRATMFPGSGLRLSLSLSLSFSILKNFFYFVISHWKGFFFPSYAASSSGMERR
jgi:hypothetical protein